MSAYLHIFLPAFTLYCIHIDHSLAIHPSVVDLAKVEFSRFRDVREAVQQYDGVVASCLVLAFQGTFDSRPYLF